MLNAAKIIALGLVVMVAACSDTGHDAPTSGQQNSSADEFSLTDDNFEAFLASINRAHLMGEPRERLRQEWRRKTAFAQKARDAGLDRDPDYQSKLAQFQREALAQLYVDRELETRLTDAALRALYEERKASLATDEIHLAARFFAVENPQDLQASLAAKAQAEAVLADANGDGAFLPDDVTSQITASSPGVDRSGDLGWMPVVHAQSRFGIDLSNPKEGEIIGPLNVTRGWYVLQVVENTRKKIPEFERVRRQLMEQERQRIVGELADELSGS